MTLNQLLDSLSAEEQATFQSLFVAKNFQKGDILVGEGKVADKLFLIEKGYCRSYFIDKGEDITDFFFFEDSFATDFASFYGKKPSLLNLVCQEDVAASVVKKKELEELYRQNVKFSEIGRMTAEYAFVLIEERMRLLHTESLEVKYKWMVDNFPFVFQRVPQYHIASFLGVKPQSLSRIRAKIAGKIY